MPKKAAQTDDRRSSSRAKRVLSIQYKLHKTRRKNVNTNWHLSTTEDMSLDGLSFYSDVEFKVGEELDLHVVMSGILDIYKGSGKVIRVEQRESGNFYLVGVKFNLRKSSPLRKAKAYTRKSAEKP